MNLDPLFLKRLIRALGEFLGDKCEIVVHDYRNGFDHTITDIVNGDLSGRKVGDAPRGALIVKEGQALTDLEVESPIYTFQGDKGRTFRGCTVFIADENDKIEGAICINYEISELIAAQNVLQGFIQKAPDSGNEDNNPLLQNVDEFLQYYINQCEQFFGKQLAAMNKNEKIDALQYLDQKGVFKITKANLLLCSAFNISRFTLYNYLEESRNRKIPIG